MRMLLVAAIALSASAHADSDWRIFGETDGAKYYMRLGSPRWSADGLPLTTMVIASKNDASDYAGHRFIHAIDCKRKLIWLVQSAGKRKTSAHWEVLDGASPFPVSYDPHSILMTPAGVICGIRDSGKFPKAYDLPESLQ